MSSSEDEVTLSDKYATLLQRSIDQSRRFEENMSKKDDLNDTRMNALLQKIESLEEKLEQSEQPISKKSKGNQAKKSVVVPKQCRQDFRKMYKSLKSYTDFEGFVLNEGASSKANKEAYTRVATAIENDYSGKCPWSSSQLRESAITYHKTLSDAMRRKKSKKDQLHKVLCRRQGRTREKLARRIESLEKIAWNEKTKEEVLRVLTPEYTSSDESEYEESSDSEEPEIVRYNTKALPWQRTRLLNAKNALDKVYFKSLKKRTKSMLVPRKRGIIVSMKAIPEDIIDWAVKRVVIPSAESASDSSGNQSLFASGISTSTPNSGGKKS